MSVDIETALNGEVSEVEQPETTEVATVTEEVTESAEVTEPTGEETSTPEVSEPDLAAQLEDVKSQVDAFKAKAIDETGKRQQLERQFQAIQQQSAQEKPDFWDDPDKAISSIGSQVDDKLQAAMTDMSEEVMRAVHPDYEEKRQIFLDAADQNPALVAQMAQAPNRAKFAYEYGNVHSRMAEFSDPDAYEAKIEAKVRAEIEAEKKAEIEAGIKKHTQIPGSLASERSSGGNQAAYQRPDLDQIIGQ